MESKRKRGEGSTGGESRGRAAWPGAGPGLGGRVPGKWGSAAPGVGVGDPGPDQAWRTALPREQTDAR